jgi:Domain of unknown function (DU1801)
VVGVSDDVERLLAAQMPHIAELARHTCGLVLDLLPDAVVTADRENIGFGTGPGYSGLVFVVAPHRAHVTLGIYGGADLPDPTGLMQGTGKVHRHVKVRDSGDLERPELRQLMAAALARRS